MRRLGRIGGYAGASAIVVALVSAPATYSGTRATAGIGAQTSRSAAIVATARGKVPVYRAPGKKRAFVTYSSSNGYGQPRVFLVKQRRARLGEGLPPAAAERRDRLGPRQVRDARV